MNENSIKARKAYMKQWRKDNPERVRIYAERFWERKAKEAEALQVTEPEQAAENKPDSDSGGSGGGEGVE